jgi:hypothetical protein
MQQRWQHIAIALLREKVDFVASRGYVKATVVQGRRKSLMTKRKIAVSVQSIMGTTLIRRSILVTAFSTKTACFRRFPLSVFLRHVCVFGGVNRVRRRRKGDKNTLSPPRSWSDGLYQGSQGCRWVSPASPGEITRIVTSSSTRTTR